MDGAPVLPLFFLFFFLLLSSSCTSVLRASLARLALSLVPFSAISRSLVYHSFPFLATALRGAFSFLLSADPAKTNLFFFGPPFCFLSSTEEVPRHYGVRPPSPSVSALTPLPPSLATVAFRLLDQQLGKGRNKTRTKKRRKKRGRKIPNVVVFTASQNTIFPGNLHTGFDTVLPSPCKRRRSAQIDGHSVMDWSDHVAFAPDGEFPSGSSSASRPSPATFPGPLSTVELSV